MDATKQATLEYAKLTGSLVTLRPLSVNDVAVAFPLVHGRKEITDWLVWDGPETPEDMVPWYENWIDRGPEGSNYHFAVCERDGGAFCGSISLRFDGHEFQGDVGYWLAVEKWGRGYISEALDMIVWLAFHELQAQLVYALAFEGNRASARVLEKCGFERDEAGRTEVEKLGERRVEEFFAISHSRWSRLGQRGAPAERELSTSLSADSRSR